MRPYQNGASSVKELMQELKIATQCGSCLGELNDMVERNTQTIGSVLEKEPSPKDVQIYIPVTA